ncbi:MAG: nuclear transport factor 2 family protein [Deltaproteobacteria bacterium]|nr:nuclear transport factor 2 family protein [Deltaproteobacteria bacterium]
MKSKVGHFTVFFVCMTIALALFAGSASGADKKGIKEISDGERAFAMMTVQNVFSKHAFYHQASKHCEEIADIWVAEDGPNAKTARWILNASEVLQGIDKIKDRYCTKHVEGLKKTLEALSKKVPSVKNIPENISAGAEYVMHTQETPVIEVAGDGKTAKMLCYSIGLSVQGSVDESGNTSTRSMWMWEKYAVDFIKEDGEWKIWHLVNIHDEGPSESGSQGQGGMPGGQGGAPGGQGGAPGGQDMAQGEMPPGGQGGMPGGQGGAPGGQGGAPGGQGGSSEGVPDYFRYSPTEPLRIDPPFPEPYYTFSETFSY